MDILTTKANGILTIEFNRPERKNAITGAMYQTMADALLDAETTRRARHPHHRQTRDLHRRQRPRRLPEQRAGAGAMTEDRPGVPASCAPSSGCSKPVVAAVAGAAVGIGTTLLMHCDLVYCRRQRQILDAVHPAGPVPGIRLVAAVSANRRLPARRRKAAAGRSLHARRKRSRWASSSKVLPAAELLPSRQGQAAKLVALPAASIRTTKALMKRAARRHRRRRPWRPKTSSSPRCCRRRKRRKRSPLSSRSASRTFRSSTKQDCLVPVCFPTAGAGRAAKLPCSREHPYLRSRI